MSPAEYKWLVYLILQFLDEQNFKETMHKLEQESGFYFDMKFFEEEVLNGNWDEVEKYLCGFIKVDDNKCSLKIFFTIRKQKYLEALDKLDREKAAEILIKDLKVVASSHEDLYKDLTQLLTLENFRENKDLSMYEDTKSERARVLVELKKIIELHPLLCDKLQFPTLKSSTLLNLLYESLKWHNQQYKNPSPNPENKTMFVDHTCGQPNGAQVPPPANKGAGCSPLGAHGPLQSAAPAPRPLVGCPAMSGGAIGCGARTNAAMPKQLTEYPADTGHVTKRSRPGEISEEINLRMNMLPVTYLPQSHPQGDSTPKDITQTVARTPSQPLHSAAPAPTPVVSCPAMSDGATGCGARTNSAMPMQLTEYPADTGHVTKRSRPGEISEEINLNMLAVAYLPQSHPQGDSRPEDITQTVGRTLSQNGDDRGIVDPRPRRADESISKLMMWKFTEISEPAQCRSLRLMDNLRSSKIFRLVYTSTGVELLALASNAIHLLWKWPCNENNSSGKATASVSPQLWQPPDGILMANDVTDMNLEDAVHCFALSKNNVYVMSASGGKISLFNMWTFKTMETFMPPPPAATYLEFHPRNNNVIAIGMEDSTIHIFNVVDDSRRILRGHLKKITGLAFSNVLNVLISSGADAQICKWRTHGWVKKKSIFLPMPLVKPQFGNSDTRVQFHRDEVHILVVHETHIAIYEAKYLGRVIQWVPPKENAVPVTHATFSCDCQLVYATFMDATVCIFNGSNLEVICRILPSAYLPSNLSATVHPSVIAAHPSEPNQFALGMTDGAVYVLEPVESSEATWGVAPLPEHGSTRCIAMDLDISLKL